VDRGRFKTIAFKVGDGDKSNYIELALEIEEKCGSIEYLCTDKNPTHKSYKLANVHVASKSETCLVESFNSSLRDMLARLNRRTKRFSKCQEMLRLTLVMFFNKNISYSVYLY
jgi:insertion element IS1 protein InsB